MAKILIVEDEANIRSLVRYDLKSLDHQIDECENGNEGLMTALQGNYDVLIIDWMLPDLSGDKITERLREEGIQAIIIMLTAKDSEEDIITAFECGVDDYITKPFSPRELTARINAHLKRFISENDTTKTRKFGNMEINSNRRTVKINDEDVQLTKTEYELLTYFIDNRNIVLSRDTILNQIWGFSYDGDTRIVDVHIFKLRNKLRDADYQIKANRGVGYILES